MTLKCEKIPLEEMWPELSDQIAYRYIPNNETWKNGIGHKGMGKWINPTDDDMLRICQNLPQLIEDFKENKTESLGYEIFSL